jgi:hypothetical protein
VRYLWWLIVCQRRRIAAGAVTGRVAALPSVGVLNAWPAITRHRGHHRHGRAPMGAGASNGKPMVENQPHPHAISASAERPLPHPLFEHEGMEPGLDTLFGFRARTMPYNIAVMIGETSA